MNLTELEKGYIAGLIDGQGSICLTKEAKEREFKYPNIELTSTTFEIVSYLKDKLGGTISKRKNTNVNWKTAWKWMLRTNATIQLLEEIQNYLLVPEKQYKAKLITSKYKKITPRNGRYTEELKEAKRQFEKDFYSFNE